MSEMTPAARAEAQREAIRTEYGKYEATEAIDIDGVRAFNVGDRVPISHVEAWDQPQVEENADGDWVPNGKTIRIEPRVRLDQVKKVTAKKTAKAAAPKES